MKFKDKEPQIDRLMGQFARLAKNRCYYTGMAINPECCSCDGKDKECDGFVTYDDFPKMESEK